MHCTFFCIYSLRHPRHHFALGNVARPFARPLRATVNVWQASPDYIYAIMPSLAEGGAPDNVEMRLLPDEPLVVFRVLAQRPSKMPPFCVRPGCINGNAPQRRRLEQLRDDNALVSEDEGFASEKTWVPIFLH